MAPFHAKAKLRQTAHANILLSAILIQKRAHQIVEHAYHQTTHFFMSQNDHHLGDAINFDCTCVLRHCVTERDYLSITVNWMDGAKDHQGGRKKGS